MTNSSGNFIFKKPIWGNEKNLGCISPKNAYTVYREGGVLYEDKH